VSAGAQPARPSLQLYEALGEHAELQLELAGRGELAELAALSRRWEELVEGLPADPPPEAAPMIERAKLMHERTAIELVRCREALLAELATIRQAGRAATGYAPVRSPASRVDQSA